MGTLSYRYERAGRVTLCTGVLLLVFLTNSPLAGQSTAEDKELASKFSLRGRLSGSYGDLGAITKLETAVSYDWNDHFGITAGLPFYFVSPSTALADSGIRARNGIGNAFLDLRFSAYDPALNFASTLTVTAPTGDRDSGFSTGRPTFDWNNLFFRSFSQFTPYINLGIANTISDTPFFVRPFSTLGVVGHVEAGTQYALWRSLGLGASVYAILPSGEQKVFSRLLRDERPGPPASTPGAARANQRRVFETAPVTTGDAEIARDRGFSTWVSLRPASSVNLSAGYSRSTFFAVDSFFFSLGLELRSVFRKPGQRTASISDTFGYRRF
jgi:hypothetical protein